MREHTPIPLAERLRSFIAEQGFDHNQRLPPERALSEALGVPRGELRRALDELENDGLIWRHVGRGTFVGSRSIFNLDDVDYMRKLASPIKIIEARMAIEPELARLSAINGVKADFDEIERCHERCVAARDWRTYEAWDNNLHLAIAKATHNKILIHLFETLNVVRRSIVWGQPRSTKGPAPTHESFAEHRAILIAISQRDAPAATDRMRDHLLSVQSRIIPLLVEWQNSLGNHGG
jgi:GntR family uxuAB operon transcriptional repressor